MKFGFGWTAWLLACALAACGGGGGGASGGGSGAGPAGPPPSGNAADGAWLTFNPAAPTVTQYEGESTSFTVKASASRTFAQNFNIGIVDAKGVITSQIDLNAESQAYVATLRTAPTLGAGTHTTSLVVRVCEDSPLTCAKPFPGSPWNVPLTVQVKTKAEAAARLTLAVPEINVSTYPGDAVKFNVVADLNSELASRTAKIGIVDPANLTIVPAERYTFISGGHQVFELQTALDQNVAAGKYSSKLELRMCLDDVRTCREPVAGSPWIVPLTVNVTSPTNLSALAPIDGLGGWSTFQGNAAHTGYAAASFDPAVFTRRWRLAGDSSYSGNYTTTALDSGKVFTVRRNAGGYFELVALSEDSGAVVWKNDFGGKAYSRSPAAANGRVYSVVGDQLTSFDQATGKLVGQDQISSQSFDFTAPTVFGGDAYVINGYYGGLAKFSDKAGKFSWQVSMTVSDGWSPATDGNFVYTYSSPDNILTALNAADGSRAYSIGADFPYTTKFVARPVMLTDANQAIVAFGPLTAYDLTTRKQAWSVGASYNGVAAYANGTIYALANDGRTLEARASSNGSLLWSTATGGFDFANVIVTKNLAFVSSPTSTFAIELATRKLVWTYPRGGPLAISQRGVLYIQSAGNGLDAINLR